eukprot:2549329-Rhodomonas_salina.2
MKQAEEVDDVGGGEAAGVPGHAPRAAARPKPVPPLPARGRAPAGPGAAGRARQAQGRLSRVG